MKSNVLQNRQATIVTIHNYGKVYDEVEDNVSFQHVGHVGGDWWQKHRVVELYKNFYPTSSFIKRAGYTTGTYPSLTLLLLSPGEWDPLVHRGKQCLACSPQDHAACYACGWWILLVYTPWHDPLWMYLHKCKWRV